MTTVPHPFIAGRSGLCAVCMNLMNHELHNGIDAERRAVERLGIEIGFGRMMQLAEQIWNERMPGAAHSVGPCVSMLVACPCPKDGRDANGHCEWCCGEGRVTERVLKAMTS